MKTDPEHLRRHYAALSNAALLQIDGDDLVDEARTIYAEEVARRKLAGSEPDPAPEYEEEWDDRNGASLSDEEEPEWLEDAGCACTFQDAPGRLSAPDAGGARQLLHDAGIPCYVATERLEAPDTQTANPGGYFEYRLMVPGKRLLEATSVLDRGYFNEEVEAKWKAHFEELSDRDFRELDMHTLLAGYLDLIERLKRTYENEALRRKRIRH